MPEFRVGATVREKATDVIDRVFREHFDEDVTPEQLVTALVAADLLRPDP